MPIVKPLSVVPENESLRQKQSRFLVMVAHLILKAQELGLQGTGGDFYRAPELHGVMGEKKGYGYSKSCHKIRLAFDLNLFDATGKFLSSTEDHKILGEWWEAQSPDARWGGRFNDGNHYSLEHEGNK